MNKIRLSVELDNPTNVKEMIESLEESGYYYTMEAEEGYLGFIIHNIDSDSLNLLVEKLNNLFIVCGRAFL